MSVSPSLPLTYLFVPGNRPERFAKAQASGAGCIIIDLEDAVAPAEKALARRAIAEWMGSSAARRNQTLIRINDDATPWHTDDMALIQAIRAGGAMLPKCGSAKQVASALQVLPADATVLPLIETASGMLALREIASAPGVARLAFGSLDYMADLDIPANSPTLDFSAAQIVIASRAAGIPSPVAGVTPELDAARVSADMAHARALGFGAKMCIHPSQVPAVLKALAPGEAELAWAQRVLKAWVASAGSAIRLDGKMVDRPVVLKAERIAAWALQAG
jgi:citrate lyase subunit beta/citryl-CoA lyase